MISREELLLLLVHTSPARHLNSPSVSKATRLQKLMFLATRESSLLAQLCPNTYQFVPYDYGPYSSRLDQDVRRLAQLGLLERPNASSYTDSVEELTFEYLVDHLDRPNTEFVVVVSSKGARTVNRVMERLRGEGLDPDLILKAFEEIHGRFTGLNVETLLRYVYEKYPEYAIKSKRQDLRPPKPEDYDEDGDES